MGEGKTLFEKIKIFCVSLRLVVKPTHSRD